MMKNFSLKYGKSEVSFVLDGARSIQTLTENPMNTIEDIHAAFLKAVSTDVIESPALDQLVSPEDQITIVISDMTRFWMRQDIICEELVRYLNEVIGIPFEHIVVLIGLGTHHKNTPADQKVLTGAYVYDHVAAVVDHDCDAPDLVDIGTTSYGTRVLINPLSVGRKVICIGGTVHHLMAGYGGGRKSIVPGIAGRETIRHNHAMALDPQCEQSDPRVGPGKFNNNPINEDMREAGALLHPVFGINIVVNSASRHSGLFCGDFDVAWRESCKYVQQCYGLPIKDQADVVFVSCGGFPKDLNFYQGSKSLFNAVRAVKPGGTLVMLAECSEGAGAKDFFDWLTPLREGHLDQSLREAFTIAGYIFYAACENIRKANILLLAGPKLDARIVNDMGIRKYDRMEDIMADVDIKDKDVYIIPYGGSVMPQTEADYTRFSTEI